MTHSNDVSFATTPDSTDKQRRADIVVCHRSNCGELCLCMRCHARKALETLDPGWAP